MELSFTARLRSNAMFQDSRRRVDILLRVRCAIDDDLVIFTGKKNAGIFLNEFAVKNRIPEGDVDGAADYIKNDDNDNDDETVTGIAG